MSKKSLQLSEEEMGRREFLRRAGAAGAILAGAGAAAAILHNRPTAIDLEEALYEIPRFGVEIPKTANQMTVVHGQNVEAMIRAGLDRMGGIGAFVKKGDRVLLKPNVGFDRSPKLGATTNPDTVSAMTRLCFEAGARSVTVADNPINSPEGSFKKSKIQEAAERFGGQALLPADANFRKAKVPGTVIKEWSFFYKAFDGADKVIGLPTVKDHNLCQASMSMKNWYGLLGEGRNRFHQKIHEVVADLAEMTTPTLVVMDATRILMKNGPTGGRLSDVKPGDSVILGVDQVAIDSYALTLLEKDADKVEYLKIAAERGIGTPDWSSLRFEEIQA